MTAWSAALHSVAPAPLTPAQRADLLRGLTGRLGRALLAEPFDAAAGTRIGADLVAAGFATPEVLGRTLTMIGTRLPADLALPAPAPPDRLTALVEALAGGFTAALRDRALDAQESLRAAALSARARAEHALRDSEARLHHLLTHDPVTGLPNRTRFTQRVSDSIAAAAPDRRLAVCCLDLDRFAAVTDSLGHAVGDRLLRAVADRLRGLAGPAGWLVAHLDTAQFAILVEDTSDSEDATKAADRALSLTFAEPFQVDDVELPVTARAGVAEWPVAGAEAVEVIRAAQIALHWAKADSARWRLFCPERSVADADRYRLSAAMPKALRRGEFTLAYQPLVDLASHRLVGLEALARWRHRGRLLCADRFIGLAERTGLIVPLSNRLLALACQQAAVWHQMSDTAPYVSVNLAAAQLHQPGLVGQVAQVLDRTGLPPHQLQLEVTEDAVVNTAALPEVLAGLARLGVRVAVDDFGIGYSNLARLHDLPLHGVKLDASLARGPRPGRDPASDAEFLAAVVALGHTRGLTVTAEGIESAEHAERMRAAGCDTGQGWHLGRPAPAHHITPLLDRRTALL